MVLLKKWTVSVNLSLSGTQEFLNSKLLTEGGPTDMLDDQGELSDPDARRDLSLPGSKRGDPSSRRKQAEVRVSGVAFSPAGTAFCAASTEGLLVYSTDAAVQFDPFDLTIEVTPAATLAVLEQERDYVKALVMAFRLNDMGLVGRVFQAVPPADISLVVAQVPTVYLGRLLKYVAAQTEESPHVEFCLLWVRGIVDKHGAWLAANRGKLDVELRLVSRAVARMRDDIRRLADDNVYTVAYLVSQAGKGGAKTRSGTMAAAIDVLMPVAADVDMDSGEAAAAAGDDSEGEWMGFE
jgi:periodic tryptophan protein 2